MTPLKTERETFSLREVVREHIEKSDKIASETNLHLNNLNLKLELLLQNQKQREQMLEKHETALIELDRRHHEQKGAFWALGVVSAAIGSVATLFAKKLFHL